MGFALLGLILGGGILFFKGFPKISGLELTVALVCGAFYLLAELLYYKAAQLEEISRVISLLYLDPLFTAVLSAFFLREFFSPLKYLGVGLLVSGAIAISYKKGNGLSFKGAFWFCILSAFLFACYNLQVKFLVNRMDFWTAFSYIRFGTFLCALPIFYFQFGIFKKLAQEHAGQFSLMMFNNFLVYLGAFFYTIASSLGYATLTTSINAIQPLFVLILTVAFSIFYPAILKEELNKRVIFQKLFAVALMFAGVLLIT